jgi:predicted RNase H-like HicB family nuclease
MRQVLIQNIREAIDAYVLTLKDDGLALPPDRFDALL